MPLLLTCPGNPPSADPGSAIVDPNLSTRYPIDFRLRNYTETDSKQSRLCSSKHLKQAYQKEAEAIGWQNCRPGPGSQRDEDRLIDYGMSTGTFNAFRWEATCRALLKADGVLTVQSAITDIGPETGKSLTNVLGVPLNRIKVAVFNATGQRIRDLPNTPDKLLRRV